MPFVLICFSILYLDPLLIFYKIQQRVQLVFKKANAPEEALIVLSIEDIATQNVYLQTKFSYDYNEQDSNYLISNMLINIIVSPSPPSLKNIDIQIVRQKTTNNFIKLFKF